MSETKSLDELTKLAQPALRHAELVQLARTVTPNRAFSTANSRWPSRQATAARFLAMVRRDYGSEPFEALVSRLEHARVIDSEHAHGDQSMNLNTLYPDGVRDVVFYNIAKPCTSERLLIRHIDADGNSTDFKLTDQITKLGLDETQLKLLVRRVIAAMLEQWANREARQFAYGSMWETALCAVRTHLPEDEDLLRVLLLTTIVYYGGNTKHEVSIPRAIMPDSMRAVADASDGESQWEDYSLQDVVDYLLSCGISQANVCQAWVDMIGARRRATFKTACIVPFYHNIKVGDRVLDQEPRIVDVARELLVYELGDFIEKGCGERVSGQAPEHKHTEQFLDETVIVLMNNAGFDWKRSDAVREIIEGYFVACFARGAAATAHYFLARYGPSFNLLDQYDRGSFDITLEKLMRCAIAVAEDAQRYGIATALAEYIGEESEADRLREFARAFNQCVALQFGF